MEKVMTKTMNSPLVTFTLLSPNNSGQRTHEIDRITPHCAAGQCSVETLGYIFAPQSRQASSNYGIGVDGRVGMYVEEKNRSWCSSSKANDQRAVTIECASDMTSPCAFNSVVYERLVELCVDICKRNGKTKLTWIPEKNLALTYQQASDEMLLTLHRWFANTGCPGDWLITRLPDLAARVTAALSPTSKKLYRVQVGAFSKKENADTMIANLKKAGFNGVLVETTTDVEPSTDKPLAFTPYTVRIDTDVLNVRKSPSTTSQIVTTLCKNAVYTIVAEQNGWGQLKSGAGWINLAYTKKH